MLARALTAACCTLASVADDDPLPSFEKRQALSNELGMTPRSVQIWFQNRRQRLLKPNEGGELSLLGDESDFSDSRLIVPMQSEERSPTARQPPNEGVPLGKPLIKPKKVDTPIILPSQLPSSPASQTASAWQNQARFQAQHQNSGPMLPPQTMPPPGLRQFAAAEAAHGHAYPVTAAHLVHAFAPLLRAEQHRAEQQQQQQQQQQQHLEQQHLEQQQRQFEEQQRQAHRPAPSNMQPQQCLQQQQQAAWQECMNAAARMPSEDPSLPDTVSSLAPAAQHRADSSDWQNAPAGWGGVGAVSTLPLLMSRLGGLMAMCGSNNRDRDPAVAISQALAMLPQAVAAGQLSPGAAALLMQALQQQVNAIVGGGWAPAAAACHAGNSCGNGDSQTFVPTGSLASSPLPSPSSRRQPLPSHLGGPPDWWHAAATSQMPPNAANHLPTPFFTAAVPVAAAPAQAHAAAAGPVETEATSVDALLLLSACADMQRSSSSSSSSTSRSGSGADAPFPTDRAAGASLLG